MIHMAGVHLGLSLQTLGSASPGDVTGWGLGAGPGGPGAQRNGDRAELGSQRRAGGPGSLSGRGHTRSCLRLWVPSAVHGRVYHLWGRFPSACCVSVNGG